jgi:parallel beta-helix repeat protein
MSGTQLVKAPGDAWITLNPPSPKVSRGDNFTITVNVSNVDLMDAWQIILKYNLTTMYITDLWIPTDNIFGDPHLIPQVSSGPEYHTNFDEMGYVIFGNSLILGNVSVTDGILFKANCTILGEGSTAIMITDLPGGSGSSALLLYNELFQTEFAIPQPVYVRNAALTIQQTIYIRADGSIAPPTAPMQRDGDAYTLTGNITSDADGIVVERDNVVVDGSGCTVEGTGAFTSSLYGIYLDGRSNVTIQNMNIKSFDYGIWLNSSSNNKIDESNITNNWGGILLRCSSNNSMSKNTIKNNSEGIWLAHSSEYNRINGNTIKNNNYEGILMDSSSNNSICHNNFVNNTRQVYYIVAPVANFWDDGFPSGGNYWSDYNGMDADHDAIGDVPHVIDANNTDHYPLMGSFKSFDVSSSHPDGFEEVDVISNFLVSDLFLSAWLTSPNQYLQAGQLFLLLVPAQGQNMTAGFCRMTLPNDILNTSDYTVLINLTAISLNKLAASNNTHTTLYFSFNTTDKEEIIIVPEFPSVLILAAFMMATLLAVIVCRKKRICIK